MKKVTTAAKIHNCTNGSQNRSVLFRELRVPGLVSIAIKEVTGLADD